MHDWSEIKYFTKSEFSCKCGCGQNNIDFEFVRRLDVARKVAGVPFVIVSGYRCPEHNKKVGGVDYSSHVRGFAADIKTEDAAFRFALLSGFIRAGFVRIGLYSSFIHVDVDPLKLQNLAWSDK